MSAARSASRWNCRRCCGCAGHFPDRHAAAGRYFDLADYMVWRASGADVASVCTLTCKWNYLAHEQRFSDSLLGAVGLGELLAKVPAEVRPARLGRRAADARQPLPTFGLQGGHRGRRPASSTRMPAGWPCSAPRRRAGSRSSAAPPAATWSPAAPPVMVPGVWGPYFGAMLPGWWLNEGGQSAAGSLIDWTLRQCDAWPALEAAARRAGSTRLRGCQRVGGGAAEPRSRADPAPARAGRPPRQPLAAGRSARARHHGRAYAGSTGRTRWPAVIWRRVQALAYGTRHIIESLNAAGHRIERVVVTGGGARNALSAARARRCHRLRPASGQRRGGGRRWAAPCWPRPPPAPSPPAGGRGVRWCGPARTIRADPARRAFHDANIAVYLRTRTTTGIAISAS